MGLRGAGVGARWWVLLSAGAMWLSACVLDRGGAFDAPDGTSGAQGGGGPSSSNSATSGSGATSTSAMSSGTGGLPVACGNGTLEKGEACDDGDVMQGDGCDTSCQVELGWECKDMPSVCSEIQPVIVSSSATPVGIPDNTYTGMTGVLCRVLSVTTAYTSIQDVQVTIALTHTWVGDLTIKVVSPSTTLTTLMSRPGMSEQADNGADCLSPPCTGTSDYGDSSNVSIGSPINFSDAAGTDAETLGLGLTTSGTACSDNSVCDYFPNSGAAAGNGLVDFVGTDPNGDWAVCVGDSTPGETGNLGTVTLSILAF